MYKRVKEGVVTFKHNDEIMTSSSSSSEEISFNFELPKTYIMCEDCNSVDIDRCPCFPINYKCPKCGWEYKTHVCDVMTT